jgi:HJR/Mrr/RecB family endonuclease
LAAGNGLATFPNRPVGEEELRTINGYALESLCALLWDKQGFHTHQTPKSGDGGVDVVAWKDEEGVLIQCKASSQQGQALGWEAVKDVSAGARAYSAKYPDVHFRRIAVTNQQFNDNARNQAGLLKVELIERDGLLALLKQHPIQLQEFLLAVM